mgnify:FL=1
MEQENTKDQILKKIQEYYGFKKQVDFAHFLGITPNCLNGWYKHKRLNYQIVSTKCTKINAKWILTGEGPMLAEEVTTSIDQDPEANNTTIPEKFIQQLFDERRRHDEIILSQQKTIEMLTAKLHK